MFCTPGYPIISGIDLWTSGADTGSTDEYAWCSIKRALKTEESNWKMGEPKPSQGDCIFMQFSSSNANDSTFALGNCADDKNFVCEVIFHKIIYIFPIGSIFLFAFLIEKNVGRFHRG
jgi:hypothetical protein